MDPVPTQTALGAIDYLWRLAVTLFFVAANGFFVAAEFALVKVRETQLSQAAAAGSRAARTAAHIRGHLDHYLSACQLGITLSSLILGWLAEPAVATLLLAVAGGLGVGLDPHAPWVHGIALAIALTVVTILHMTLGEQAPKIWAIQRSQWTAVAVALPLQVFAVAFRPFIWLINELSNGLLRLVGLSATEIEESAHNVDELKLILTTSASEGHISDRQLEIAQNVFDMMELEVRHILVPRVDVAYLSLQRSDEENLAILQDSGHSRLPLCDVGLDTVMGIVHTKDVMRELAQGRKPELRRLGRAPVFVPDTQPLSRMIVRMQRAQHHCAVVVDEHGTAIGMAFLEDAIEEILGPMADEFDEPAGEGEVEELPGGGYVIPGSWPLPDAGELLGLQGLGEESDTIGGHIVALLGRIARVGDELALGPYRVRVVEVARRRIERLRFELGDTGGEAGRAVTPESFDG